MLAVLDGSDGQKYESKKQGTTILSITSPNVDRFSFFSLTDSLVNMQQNRH